MLLPRSKTVLTVLLTFSLAACAGHKAPVQMVGAATDVSALAGEWSGDYSSAETGRAGSISFKLRAADDSAFGDVVMVPAGSSKPLQKWHPTDTPGAQPTGSNQSSPSTILTIRFVRIESGHVSGNLDPYADPTTGARLFTTFSGELKADSISGSYTTRLLSGQTQSGRWSVKRR